MDFDTQEYREKLKEAFVHWRLRREGREMPKGHWEEARFIWDKSEWVKGCCDQIYRPKYKWLSHAKSYNHLACLYGVAKGHMYQLARLFPHEDPTENELDEAIVEVTTYD